MLIVAPFMMCVGISTSTYAAFIVPLLVDTMEESLSKQQKLATSLYALIGMGVGEILGA